MDARVLIDGRYRLEAVIRRSKTVTVHAATHRNGASAWLKMPVSAAHAELLAVEARIANAIGSPLTVRDDGVTPEGLPYLVLDPPDGQSVAALCARGRPAAARLSAERVMNAGDALARLVSSVHAAGYVTAGLEDDDVLIFANGDVALLDLHAVVPATPAGILADCKGIVRVLSVLVCDAMDAPSAASVRPALDRVLRGAYSDVAVLQLAWRGLSPAAHGPPSPTAAGFGAVPGTPPLPVHDTPLSVTLGNERAPEADGSVIDYLRYGGLPQGLDPSLPPQQRPVMYDPLTRLADMPRLVQETSRCPDSRAGSSRRSALIAALIAVPLLGLVAGAAVLVSASGSHPSSSPRGGAAAAASTAASAAPLAEPVVKAASPAVGDAPTSAPAAPAEPVDELEMTTTLRTESAPPDRDVFIDGKAVGRTPLEVAVPCGHHDLQMTAGARRFPVELPCGGERVIRYDAKGHWTIGK